MDHFIGYDKTLVPLFGGVFFTHHSRFGKVSKGRSAVFAFLLFLLLIWKVGPSIVKPQVEEEHQLFSCT